MSATVAIVDDDPVIRESATLLFEVSGWVGKPYASAYAFLADLARDMFPDCAIIDLHMPEMNGAELVDQLLERGFQIPVILLTGDTDDPLVKRLLNVGVLYVLRKPADSEQLLEYVASIIAEHPRQ